MKPPAQNGRAVSYIGCVRSQSMRSRTPGVVYSFVRPMYQSLVLSQVSKSLSRS